MYNIYFYNFSVQSLRSIPNKVCWKWGQSLDEERLGGRRWVEPVKEARDGVRPLLGSGAECGTCRLVETTESGMKGLKGKQREESVAP